MKLHMATVVKIKNKKKNKLSVCNEASEVLKYLFDGTKPSSLLLFLPPHTNPATHTEILVRMSCSYICASLFSTKRTAELISWM